MVDIRVVIQLLRLCDYWNYNSRFACVVILMMPLAEIIWNLGFPEIPFKY